MESEKTNEDELTSTMGSLMSTSKDEKNDACDSTPTSSTDAFTTTSSSHMAADDPISSTSSDLLDSRKNTEKLGEDAQSTTHMITQHSNPVISSIKDMSRNSSSPIVSEKDLIDMNITDTSTEKITENVDDIVQDLENLLGESSTSFDYSIRSKDIKKDDTVPSQTKDISTELDEFSAELQMLQEKTDLPTQETLIEASPSLIQSNNDNSSDAIPSEHLTSKIENESAEVEDISSTHEKIDQQRIVSLEVPPEEVKENLSSIQEQTEISSDQKDTPLPDNEPSDVVDNEREVSKTEKDENIERSDKAIEKDDDNIEQLDRAVDENLKQLDKEEERENVEHLDKLEENVNQIESEASKQLQSPQEPICENITEAMQVKELQPVPEIEKEYSVAETKEIVKEEPDSKQSNEVTQEKTQVIETKEILDEKMETNEVKEIVEQKIEAEETKEIVEEKMETNEAIEIVEDETDTSEAKKIVEVIMESKETNEVVEEKTERNEAKEVVEEIIELNETNEVVEAKTETNKAKEVVDEIIESKETNEVVKEKTERNEAKEVVEEMIESKETNEVVEEKTDRNEAEEVVEEMVESKETNEVIEEKTETNEVEKSVEQEMVTKESDESVEKITELSSTKEIIEKSVKTKDNVEEKTDVAEEIQLVSELEKNEENAEIHEVETQVARQPEEVLEEKMEVSEELDQVLEVEKNEEPIRKAETEAEICSEPLESEEIVEKIEISVDSQPVLEVEKNESIEKQSEDKAEGEICNEPETVEEKVQVLEEPEAISEIEKCEIIATFSETIKPTETEVCNEPVKEAEETLETKMKISEVVGNEAVEDVQSTEVGDTTETKVIEEELSDVYVQRIPDVQLENISQKADVEVNEPVPVEESPCIVEKLIDASTVSESVSLVAEEPLPEIVDDLSNTPKEILSDAITSENLTETIQPENILDELVGNSGICDSNTEAPVLEMPSHSLAEDLDLLVQNTIGEQENKEESEISTSVLPVEEVSDLDVLNAISSLPDQSIDNNDSLLDSSTVERPIEEPISFESELPTVDEIFAEPSQSQPEIQDDNLETLLAVASLQSAGYEENYTAPTPVEFIPEETTLTKEQDERIESLFAEKGLSREKVSSQDDKLKEPLVINIDDTEKGRVYSPKITIKPLRPEVEETITCSEQEGSKGSLKMTITKQSDNTHSILKLYNPEDEPQEEQPIPKLIIKQIVQPNEQPQSPKTPRSSKQVFSPSSNQQRSASPRITIKPIPKPESEPLTPLKITIKPVLKLDERQKHSPKLTIKPIPKPEEETIVEPKMHSPRVTIKPIVKPPEEVEQVHSPRITIKPIVKPDSLNESLPTTPRVTIKPLVKPQEKEKEVEIVEKSSPKITIKPIKPPEVENIPEDFEESIKERIVLKINKGTIPGTSKELKRREAPPEEEKSEKLAKIKLKFSKEGGHPHIVQDDTSTKRPIEQSEYEKSKRLKIDTDMLSGVTITPIAPPQHSKLKEMLSRATYSSDKVVTIDDDDDDVTVVEETSKPSPIVISEESNQDSISVPMDVRDPISDIPVFEITPECVKTLNPQPVVEEVVAVPAPRKRGRPRKVPLQVREEFKDPKEEEPQAMVFESSRPKRSCRGPSVRTTLGIKPRKPRGGGRGRGGKRGMGTRSTPTPPETPPQSAKEPKLTGAKLKQLKEDLLLLSDKTEAKPIEIDDGFHKSPSQSLLAPPQSDISTTDRADIVMYEEETRMSAETSSRAQTPAKQVITSIPSVDLVEESQSSVQSTATTESVKVRKGPRLEVHQEPEGAVISADQLAEYYWSGGGPFMLQEQVAQFLGIKSFKRKYPNIQRRVVDMQERDFIRESGLASEAMCDLGLTAVNSADILDIMYSDFQDKYEEYCKHQRDRQAKDLTNKQRALSLAASQEKTKIDITHQAVQSAASWNATFNKARRDQRKACMDLQTLTVHFPKGKMKQINKPKIGYYPVALVPGQFTDYYKEFTPTEINNLPLNTMCYNSILKGKHYEMECDSQTDGSGSESDTSSSDSDSSYSGSSDAEDCTLCKPTPKRIAAAL